MPFFIKIHELFPGKLVQMLKKNVKSEKKAFVDPTPDLDLHQNSMGSSLSHMSYQQVSCPIVFVFKSVVKYKLIQYTYCWGWIGTKCRHTGRLVQQSQIHWIYDEEQAAGNSRQVASKVLGRRGYSMKSTQGTLANERNEKRFRWSGIR